MEHLTDEEIADYLEGTVPGYKRQEMEGHLVDCEDCRNELAFFMKVIKDTMSPQEAADLEQIQRNWERQGQRTEPARQRGDKFPKLLVAIIVVLVIAAIAWIAFRS